MNKTDLRAQALDHLQSIRPDEMEAEHAAAHFHQSIPIKDTDIVALYWPMKNEFDVRYILDDLIRRNIGVALPVASKDNRVMKFSLWDGKDNLVRGDFGISIPPNLNFVDPDIVIVPFLAFDRRGYRLGRGAGHYDSTLADLRARRNILAVGVGFATQAVLFNLPIEAHDQRLDMVITPSGVHDFRS